MRAIFLGKPRVELIDGQIIMMSPMGPLHNSQVDKLLYHLYQMFSDEAQLRIQGSIRIDDFSEPQPDIALLKLRADKYKNKLPTGKDIHLLVEVAVESADYDRTVKTKKYATAGVPEYWIVLPELEQIEVYRQPQGDAYLQKQTYRRGDSWTFEAFQLAIKAADILV